MNRNGLALEVQTFLRQLTVWRANGSKHRVWRIFELLASVPFDPLILASNHSWDSEILFEVTDCIKNLYKPRIRKKKQFTNPVVFATFKAKPVSFLRLMSIETIENIDCLRFVLSISLSAWSMKSEYVVCVCLFFKYGASVSFFAQPIFRRHKIWSGGIKADDDHCFNRKIH